MSDLVVIEFPSEAKAEEVRQKLLSMQKEYLIELSDAVIAVKQPNGHVKLNQLIHSTALGAATGAMWGALVGLIFWIPLAGAAIGAGLSRDWGYGAGSDTTVFVFLTGDRAWAGFCDWSKQAPT